MKGLAAREERVVAVRDTIARLEAGTDSAKRELARGTVEDLRQRLETYRGSLSLLRRLVPERNEVPNLLDDISTRSRIRGVTLSQWCRSPSRRGRRPSTPTSTTCRSSAGTTRSASSWPTSRASSASSFPSTCRSTRPRPRSQGPWRHHRLAAGGQVPGPHLREVFHPGGTGQWLVTLCSGSPCSRRWPAVRRPGTRRTPRRRRRSWPRCEPPTASVRRRPRPRPLARPRPSPTRGPAARWPPPPRRPTAPWPTPSR